MTEAGTDIVANAGRWWQDLQGDDKTPGDRRTPGDRASLARLRRASISDAMAEPATLDLFRRLGLKEPEALPRVAVIAMSLAHIREKKQEPVIRLVGRESVNDDAATLKPLRFRRLLGARTDDELAEQMRRLIALADKKGNPGRLAADILRWDDTTRARWAFDYYNAGDETGAFNQAS